MTYKSKQDDSDVTLVKIILEKGWRQGSIFDPRGILKDINLADNELLIICTQSCTVVSLRFATDPVVEAMVVKPLTKYNYKAFEATGKNQKKLHIELRASSEFKCIECNINPRLFFDRYMLLKVNPLQELEIGLEGTTN